MNETSKEESEKSLFDDPQKKLIAMFELFLLNNAKDKEELRNQRNQDQIDLNERFDSLTANNIPDDFTPVLDRSGKDRRSSMFFGDDHHTPLRAPTRTSPDDRYTLQTEIIYDNPMNTCSLDGLQHFSNQLELLHSKYEGRDLKHTLMVKPTLRPHILFAWNQFQFGEHQVSGAEYEELAIENWFSLSNNAVNQMLIEAVRPRTKELYIRDLIQFLKKVVPQTPIISADTFSTRFYGPLIKSLMHLKNIFHLLSAETRYSNNKSRMPVQGWGTKDSPGHIQCWLISLGTQRDPLQQLLGKDNLTKFKDLDSALKFIRNKLMEGRAHSEARQDFDAMLTPIRYDDYLTQGESTNRLQVTTTPKTVFPRPNASHQQTYNHRDHSDRDRYRDTAHRSSLHALETDVSLPTNLDQHNDDYLDDDSAGLVDEDCDDEIYDDCANDSPVVQRKPAPNADSNTLYESSLQALADNLQQSKAVGAIFRGYCSERFVFDHCSKGLACTYDHSADGLERCIQSFHLLSRRELGQHANLPPYSIQRPDLNPIKPAFVTPKSILKPSWSSSRPVDKPLWNRQK
jgi:hypothetical protein